MPGYDGKYGRVTTERKNIPDDEPVFVIRGQDRNAPAALRALARIYASDPDVTTSQIQAIEVAAQGMANWQEDHPGRVKAPDTGHGEILLAENNWRKRDE